MNTNTIKAALVKFMGKNVVAVDQAKYEAIAKRAPAIIQDVMYFAEVGGVGAIVTRAYGAGEEAYKVDFHGQPAKFFQMV